MFMDSKNISNQSPPKSIYARALIGDGALRWDIPPAISDRNQIFYQRIGTPFHRITECFRECLKTQSQNHFRSLTRQLLSGTRLTNVETWTGVVCELTESLVSNISQRQSTIKGLLDARQQFQTEILPEIGDPIDSCVIPGIVLRKFIAHREMARSILSPKLLLLSGALELECPNLFQLHTDIKKENDFLESAVDRILQLAPDICLVERTVARCALLRLQEENITLVCNVSMEDLTKLAIHTNAKIVQNILEVTQSCLGSCIEFSVLPVKNPTNTNNARKPFPLMIFKACSSLTASTAVLRGGSEHDLELVKEVLSFAVFAAYRLHLETAFLSDSLSITAASTTAFGIEGFASEQWKDICSSIVQKCVQETKNHQSNEAVEFVSPVISKWTSHQSHQSVFQRHEFSFPVLDLETSFLISKGQNQSSETNSITSTGLSLNPAESKIQSETKTRIAAIQPSLTNCNKEIQCPGTTSFDVYGGSASTPSSQIDNNNAQIDGEWCPWRTWSDVESLRKSFDPIPATQTQYSDSFTDHQQVKGNIMQQQKFAASFAKRNHIRGKLCEESHVKSIQFCSEGDISLMEFLKSISADSKKLCPAGCGGGNASHLLTVFHGAIRLAISVVPVPEDKIFPNSDSEIWLWTRPKGVQKSPMNSVSRIALSEEAKSLSLGQFLQLAFNTPYLKVFGRQLFLEHVLYFGFGETAACVLEDRIQLKSVTLPEPVLDYHTPLQIQWVQEAGQQILEEADLVYESVEKLCLSSPVRRKDSFKSPGGGGTTDESSKKTSESFAHESYMKFSLIPEIKEEREKFRSEVQTIMNEVLIQSVNGGKISNNEILESFLKLNALWRQLGINALSCSATMDCSLDHKSWKLSLTKSSQLEGRISRIGTRVSAPVGSGTNQVSRTPNASPERSPSVGDLHQLDSGDIQDSASTTETHPIDSMAFDGVITDSPFLSMIHEPFTRCSYEKDSSTQDQNLPVRIPSTPSCSTDDGLERLHSLNALMDDSRDNNCVKLKRNSSIGVMQMLDREVQLFYEERLTEANTQSSVSFNQHRSVSLPQSPRETTLLNQLDRRLDLSLYDDEKPLCVEDEDLDSNMTTDLHSSMLPSPFQQLPDPHGHQSSPLETGGNEVLITGPITPGIELSCRAMFPVGSDGLVIPVFESEPASIIAHVLSSISYHKELQQYFEILNSRQRNYDGSIDFEAQNLTTTMSPRPSSGPNLDVNFCRQSGPSELMQRGGKSRMNVASHIVQRLEDNPPGASTSSARFEVVSYFAPQFSKLRNRCIDGGERSFIMSMCRSKKWKTDGGKSKSYFAKTLDDRFIIKGVSKSEKASFLEQLGPCYFDYMQGQLRKKEDVSLAKILGLFQVSMKSTNNRNGRVDQNSESTDLGKDWMLDLIVMENVFYNRDCSSIYDLKGCHRTRFNSEAEKQKTTDHRPLVFLDSNLKKHNVKSPPLLVSQVSWNGLRETLCRDTNFLESNSVMDYSLLVGLDRSSNSLVISIIDYIRQFTWDKRLESWVKSSGLMGGEVNEDPTIISPKSYKDRFISTVLGYFTIVPMYDDPQ